MIVVDLSFAFLVGRYLFEPHRLVIVETRACGWCGAGWDVPLGEPGSCPSMRLADGRVLRLLWKCHPVVKERA